MPDTELIKGNRVNKANSIDNIFSAISLPDIRRKNATYYDKPFIWPGVVYRGSALLHGQTKIMLYKHVFYSVPNKYSN